MRVFSNILRGSSDRSTVTEFDQAGRLEDEESTAAIGRIVRNGNGCAVRQFSEDLYLLEKTDIGSR